MAVDVVWRDPITGKTGYTALSTDTLPNCADGSQASITDEPGRVDERIGGAWVQVRSGGSNHVTLRDSHVGPEGAPAGSSLAVNADSGIDVFSAVITSNLVDVGIPAVFTDGVRIEIGENPETASRSYLPGTHQWPITPGHKIAARSNSAATGSIQISPVVKRGDSA